MQCKHASMACVSTSITWFAASFVCHQTTVTAIVTVTVADGKVKVYIVFVTIDTLRGCVYNKYINICNIYGAIPSLFVFHAHTFCLARTASIISVNEGTLIIIRCECVSDRRFLADKRNKRSQTLLLAAPAELSIFLLGTIAPCRDWVTSFRLERRVNQGVLRTIIRSYTVWMLCTCIHEYAQTICGLLAKGKLQLRPSQPARIYFIMQFYFPSPSCLSVFLLCLLYNSMLVCLFETCFSH